MANVFVPLAVIGHSEARCPEHLGKERCDGCGFVPVNMLERAEIRDGVNKNEVVKFTCGHSHRVTVYDPLHSKPRGAKNGKATKKSA